MDGFSHLELLLLGRTAYVLQCGSHESVQSFGARGVLRSIVARLAGRIKRSKRREENRIEEKRREEKRRKEEKRREVKRSREENREEQKT
jgi:hypothetical protein